MKFRITSFGKFYLLLLTITGLALAAISMSVYYESLNISKTWDEFEQQRSEKIRALSDLDEALGYGGMLHDFKDYIIRQDPDYEKHIYLHLGAALLAIQNYLNLTPTEHENQSLMEIRNVLDEYYNKLRIAEKDIVKGISSIELDKLIVIDDEPAIRAIDTLFTFVWQHTGVEHSEMVNYSEQLSKLSHEIGYGGMISQYKNYLLRDEGRYKIAAEKSIENIRALLLLYQAGAALKEEREAAQAIAGVVDQYLKNLDIITMMRGQGYSLREIDAAAKIDDQVAFDGFDALSRSIGNRTNSEAASVTSALYDIGAAASQQLYFVVVAFFILDSIHNSG